MLSSDKVFNVSQLSHSIPKWPECNEPWLTSPSDSMLLYVVLLDIIGTVSVEVLFIFMH